MADFPDWKTIDRYLAGEATPDERAAVDAWVSAQPQREAALAWLREQSTADPSWNVDAAWQRLERTKARRSTLNPRPSTLVVRWAAAILIAVGLGATWVGMRQRAEPGPAHVHELFTLNGQRSTVTLSDGTRIALNGASRVRYDDNYGTSSRDVYLDGEAYFEVRHDAKHPFRVHARDAIAEDLGTRFTVSAYADQPTIDVAVTEGIVSLGRGSGAPVRVNAGELGVLPASGDPTVSRVATLDRYVGWTDGTLVLDGLPLRRAAVEIERWFGVKVVIADSALAARPVAARFQRESVGQVIDALALALGARVAVNGTTYTLTPSHR